MNLDSLMGALRAVSGLFALLGVPMLFYAARMLKRMDERQAMHHQTLYGETGNNGLRSDMKAVRARTHQLAEGLQKQGWILDQHGERIESLEGKI